VVGTCWYSDMITRKRFRSIDDWLAFCSYDRSGDAKTITGGLSEAEGVDAIQQVSRLLAAILVTHEDAAPLINLWLTSYGSTCRLFPVVGRRTQRPA
jgi:hypothetical protein